MKQATDLLQSQSKPPMAFLWNEKAIPKNHMEMEETLYNKTFLKEE